MQLPSGRGPVLDSRQLCRRRSQTSAGHRAAVVSGESAAGQQRRVRHTRCSPHPDRGPTLELQQPACEHPTSSRPSPGDRPQPACSPASSTQADPSDLRGAMTAVFSACHCCNRPRPKRCSAHPEDTSRRQVESKPRLVHAHDAPPLAASPTSLPSHGPPELCTLSPANRTGH